MPNVLTTKEYRALEKKYNKLPKHRFYNCKYINSNGVPVEINFPFDSYQNARFNLVNGYHKNVEIKYIGWKSL